MLATFGQLDRARLFCSAWVVSEGVTLAIFPFCPALGGYLHHGIPREATHVLVTAAWQHWDILDAARNGSLRFFSSEVIGGIVTFPSFHTSAAVLLAWAFWPMPFVRWAALIVNVAMLASSVIIGGHYVVDIFAGVGVAVISLVVVQRVRGFPAGDFSFPFPYFSRMPLRYHVEPVCRQTV